MSVGKENLFRPLAAPASGEVFEELLCGGAFRLERIVSTGQATARGEWYDQETDEWVALLSGAARLRFEGDQHDLELQPGDAVHIPAHRRHRVEWTAPDRETVWLALHYQPRESGAPHDSHDPPERHSS